MANPRTTGIECSPIRYILIFRKKKVKTNDIFYKYNKTCYNVPFFPK